MSTVTMQATPCPGLLARVFQMLPCSLGLSPALWIWPAADHGWWCLLLPGDLQRPTGSGRWHPAMLLSVRGWNAGRNVITIATITGMSIVLSVSRCVFWFFQLISLESQGGAVPGPDSQKKAPGFDWVVWLQTSVMWQSCPRMDAALRTRVR